jgi:hypothetical protein
VGQDSKHKLFAQTSPALQLLLHEPQWLRSFWVFTHRPSHSVSPSPLQSRTHRPTEQLSPFLQAVPHIPQFALSVCVFTHWPLQLVNPL